MKKVKLVAPMLAFVATVGAAHAAQVMDTSCADVSNGTFGQTASHQPVICANGKWQDPNTVPVASVNITKYSAAKKFEASYTSNSYVGTQSIRQNSDGHDQFTLAATVVAFNQDNTARVLVDFNGASWQKHVDAIVPMNAATAIATDNSGAEYRLMVKREHVATVGIRDLRASNAGPVGAQGTIPASGELMIRRDGVCVLTHYKQTKEGIAMPVVETRTYPCDQRGNAV